MRSFDVIPPRGETPEPSSQVRLRPMTVADLDTALEIERTFNAPWSREMFLQELGNPGISANLVAELDGKVRGYALWWYVADEVHIVNVAVHSGSRRRGIGRALLHAIFEAGRERGMTIATLEVRFHNLAAIALYESLGFQRVAIRKAYYADNGEDAFVMLKSLRSPSG